MIEELDVVALTRNRPDLGLAAGDKGTIVTVYGDGAYEVEFSADDGATRAMVALDRTEIDLVWRLVDHSRDRRAAG